MVNGERQASDYSALRCGPIFRLLLVTLLAACAGDELGRVPPVGAVDGYVCDPQTNGLAVAARVSGPGASGRVEATTSALGYFLLEGLAVGDQELLVQGSGWESRLLATVAEGATTRL